MVSITTINHHQSPSFYPMVFRPPRLQQGSGWERRGRKELQREDSHLARQKASPTLAKTVGDHKDSSSWRIYGGYIYIYI